MFRKIRFLMIANIRTPEALGARARAAVLRQIETLPSARPQEDEDSAARRSQAHTPGVDIMVEVLRSCSHQQRKAFTRFYLDGQSVEQICSEMQIKPEDFRSLKSRMKARFAELEKTRLRGTTTSAP
jgi:DNA-directed RNA polymerase specialized sigma24 family protein